MVDRISPTRLRQLRSLIARGQEARFYWWPEWADPDPEKGARAAVLRLDRGACQICKSRGRYTRGTIVHHVRHLRERPDLALSIYDPDTGARQLITVCKACHEEEHPEALRKASSAREPITEERWD